MSHTLPHRQRGLGLATLLLAFVAASVLLGVGLQALKSHYTSLGEQQERARWEARERLTERQAHETFAARVQLGEQATAVQLADERQAVRHADQLTTERRHATLTLPAPACLAPLARADLLAPAAPAAHGGIDGLRLTADAVRLWNSALAGEHVPAGACGTDGAATGACAADAGVTVADAWDNQAVNALTCRVDRARLMRLQDYLKKTQG